MVLKKRLTKTFKIIDTSLFLLPLIFLFIPSINYESYVNSTITSKTLFFIYGLLFILSFYTLDIIFNKRSKFLFKLSRIEISISIIFIFIVVNRYLIQLNFGFSIRFIELLGMGFLCVILRSLLFKSFIWLLLAIVISGIIQAIYGNLQLLGYYPSNHSGFRLSGSFFNPGPYAGFLVSVFPIALGLYLFREKIIKQLLVNVSTKRYFIINTVIKFAVEYVPLLGIISILLVIPASQSRASWLAILISSVLLFELRYQTIKKLFSKMNKTKKAILIIVSVLIIGISLLGVYHFKKESSDGRLFIWKTSTEIIKDNAFFGVGFDRFKKHYMNYQASYFVKFGETEEALIADNTYYTFNEFLQFIVENGIVGFIILMFVLFFIIKTAPIKENNELSVIIKISLLTIGVFAFFSYSMEILF